MKHVSSDVLRARVIYTEITPDCFQSVVLLIVPLREHVALLSTKTYEHVRRKSVRRPIFRNVSIVSRYASAWE